MSTHTYAHSDSQAHAESHARSGRNYGLFAIQMLVSAIVMYLVMYLMIASLDHFRNNLNTAYMTLAMVAPMGVVMLLTMPSMLQNRRLNLVLYAGLGVLFVTGVWFTRTQTLIGNEQFLRSMIPHHSGAILMCNEGKITDPEIIALCGAIIESQSREIAQMEAILRRI